MMLMSTYGTHEQVLATKSGQLLGIIGFNYPETVHNQYHHRDAMDSQNARRQGRVLQIFMTTY